MKYGLQWKYTDGNTHNSPVLYYSAREARNAAASTLGNTALDLVSISLCIVNFVPQETICNPLREAFSAERAFYAAFEGNHEQAHLDDETRALIAAGVLVEADAHEHTEELAHVIKGVSYKTQAEIQVLDDDAERVQREVLGDFEPDEDEFDDDDGIEARERVYPGEGALSDAERNPRLR